MWTRFGLCCSLLAVLALFPACGGDDDASPDGGDGSDAAPRIDAEPAADAPPADAMGDECLPDTPATECNFFTGCGCAEADKCSVSSTARACSPVGAGAMTAGAACTADDQCVEGTSCITYPVGGAARQCMTFCNDLHACPTTPTIQACYITITGAGGAEIARVCGDTCGLLAQDCPDALDACHPASVAAAERGICITAGTGVQGNACGAGTAGCAEGLACVTPAGGTPICSELCDRTVAQPAGCDTGTECRALTGHTMTGICLPL